MAFLSIWKLTIVRHGARLDAADKQWHLTSPTPYDPPLTYGGWNQSKALGNRIANILRTREGIEGAARKSSVIIHTSPFLRCVQTSMAISAGLAQDPGRVKISQSAGPKHTRDHSAPVLSSQSTGKPYKLGLITATAPAERSSKASIEKSLLRVDAFLGEWLTPDYYESITPPPGSTMMIASAKAEILRSEDYSSLVTNSDLNTKSHNRGFPGGWQSPTILAASKPLDGLSDLTSLGDALPRRDRGCSLSTTSTARYTGRHHELPSKIEHGVYQPPVPNYAISGSEPIPPGYVAHARDACVEVDYQWDSMRPPQQWGSGGEYGEEWSSMHHRFRAGLGNMIRWYAENDALDHHAAAASDEAVDAADLVLILVSHGAGCNALIGALTDKPVLLDVGMASLTMAVRRPSLSPMTDKPLHTHDLSLSSQYHMAIQASTEHLRRSTVTTPASSRTPSVASMTAFKDQNFDSSPHNRNASSGSASSLKRLPLYNVGPNPNQTWGSMSSPRGYAGPNAVRPATTGLWSSSTSLNKTIQTQDLDKDVVSDADSLMLSVHGAGAGAGTDDTKTKPTTPLLALDVHDPVAVADAELGVVLEMDREERGETGDDEADDIGPLGWATTSRRNGFTKRRWTVGESAATPPA